MLKNINLKKLSNLFILLLVIIFSGNISGATFTWIGGDGIWNDASNWDIGHVPTYEDKVIINSGNVRLENFGEVERIEMNGGLLAVSGTLNLFPVILGNVSMSALDIEEDATFINEGYIIFIWNGHDDGFINSFIEISGTFLNEEEGFIYMNGSYFTGFNTDDPGHFTNYGIIYMENVNQGISASCDIYNYGTIDIQSSSTPIHTNELFYIGNSGVVSTNGLIVGDVDSYINNYGEINSSFIIKGILEIHQTGSINIKVYTYGLYVDSDGEVANSGDVKITIDESSSYELINRGIIVNNYTGTITTNSYDGNSIFQDGVCHNYGTWNLKNENEGSDGIVSIEGNITNKNYGNLNIEGKLILERGSGIGNKGHMNLTSNTSQPYIDGRISNTGVINDLYGKLGQIDNRGIITRPVFQSTRIKNVLGLGSQPDVSILGWYTSSTGNISAGSYDNSTNILTLTKSASKLNSIYVLTMLNSNNATERHEVKFKKSIDSGDITHNRFISDNEETKSYEIITYPNPTTDVLNIESRNLTGDGTFEARLVNVQGITIARKKCSANCQIKIPNYLINGIYFLMIEKDGLQLQAPEQIRVFR